MGRCEEDSGEPEWAGENGRDEKRVGRVVLLGQTQVGQLHVPLLTGGYCEKKTH